MLPLGTNESECSKVRLSGRESTHTIVAGPGGGGQACITVDSVFSHWTLCWTAGLGVYE